MHPVCPFRTLPPERIVGSNDRAAWIRDGFPVSLGHSLVIPKRHVASFFEVTAEERNRDAGAAGRGQGHSGH